MAQLAILVLAVHLTWIVLVTFGAFFTRGRPLWSVVHILALLWGIAIEVSPWQCPLTIAETYFESRAGAAPYQGEFLLHYLDAIIYPNFPDWMLTAIGVAVCAANLVVYLRRFVGYRCKVRSAP
jgi:hypothetical protein